MACEICGSSNCCRSFHSLEEQQKFDDIINPYKEHIEGEFNYEVRRLDGYYKDDIEDDELYVKLSDVESMVSSIL